MRVFVGILVCIVLAIIGVLVAAFVLPAEKEEEKTGLALAPEMFAAGPEAEATAPLKNVVLAPDKQLKLWNVEHLSFVVEKRFGTRFCTELVSAAASGKVDGLMAMFLPDATGALADWKEPVEQSVGSISVTMLESSNEPKPDSVVAVLGFLTKEAAAFKEITGSQIQVQQIEEQTKGDWTARLSLGLTGVDQQDERLQSISLHTVAFKIDDELKLDSEPSIAGWSVESVTRRQSRSLLQEVTEEVGLRRLVTQIVDNWISSNTQAHRFQISVDDFDNDGDPDIAVADRERRRLLYRYDEGKGFVYATKSLRVPREFSSELPGYTTLWFDYNNDGFLDLLSGPNLLRSEEGKSLTDVSRQAGIYISQDPQNVAAADFDCDGDLDLYFTHLAAPGKQQQISFVRPDTSAGLENELWENLGDGKFRNIAEAAGATCGKSLTQSATWFYFDDDRYPDLFVTSETKPPTVLRNKGDGTFEDVSEQLGFSDKVMAGTGAVAADFNNDGLTDVYVNNPYSRYGERVLGALSADDYSDDMYQRMQSLANGSRLYRGSDDGGFTDVAASLRVNKVGWSWGATAFDLNSDGWLDVYSATGLASKTPGEPDAESCLWRTIATHPIDRSRGLPPIGPLDKEKGEFWSVNMEMAQRTKKNIAGFQHNKLFVSDRGEDFLDASAVSGADIVADSRAAIAADIDSDGDLDLIVASAGGGSLRVFRNDVAQGHRLDIRFKGTTSNRFGIGCRVTAEFGDTRTVRDLFPSAGFMATGPSHIWLGLGDAETIDRLSVRWPTGETQVFTDVATDRRVEIREDSEEIKTLLEFRD